MTVQRKLYFENIRVGEELPAMAKAPVDRVQLARYAGATGDFQPIHLDEVYARSLGMPSVYAPSSLGQGFLGQLLTDWAKGALIKRFHTKFVRLVWPGDTLVLRGRVTDRWGENGQYSVEVDLWAENQKGELALKGSAAVSLFYSAEDEHRRKLGQPPISVTVPRQNLLEVAKAASSAATNGSPKAAAKTSEKATGKKPKGPGPTHKRR
jgi:acyl dehydratase